MRRWFFVVYLVAQVGVAEPLEVFAPEFFDSNSGSLENRENGQYGCSVVNAKTPKSEANGISNLVQNYCGGKPGSVTWVKKSENGLKKEGDSLGYFLVCCNRQKSSRRSVAR